MSPRVSPCLAPSRPCCGRSRQPRLLLSRRIRVHELQANDSAADFAEDVGVKLTVQRARVRLSADWAARLGAM